MTPQENLSLAVVRFLGYREKPYPAEDTHCLIRTFGETSAIKLQADVNQLLDELNQLKPDWGTHSLASAGAWAKEQMHYKHPDLNDEALDALGWTFTWWWP